MLMTDFTEWLEESEVISEREVFEDFFEEWAESLTVKEIFRELAWQTYQLQTCVEGLIEDTV